MYIVHKSTHTLNWSSACKFAMCESKRHFLIQFLNSSYLLAKSKPAGNLVDEIHGVCCEKIDPRRMKCPLNGSISAALQYLWAFGGGTAPPTLWSWHYQTIYCSNIKRSSIYSPLEFGSVIFEGKKKRKRCLLQFASLKKKRLLLSGNVQLWRLIYLPIFN